MSSAPLKAGSLSELRDLQRQVSKLAAHKHRAGRSSESAGGSSGDDTTSTTQAKRRPHRFLPPGTASRVRAPVAGAGGPSPTSTTIAKPDVATSSQPRDSTPSVNTPPDHYSPAAERFKTPPVAPVELPGHNLGKDDIALFRRVVQSVTPTAKSNRALLPPVPPATPAQLQQRRQHAMGQRITPALDVSDQYASAGIDRDDTVFLQTGHGPHLIKGLKKGKWQVQASLDLHGSTLDEARERMDRFIQSCRDHQIRCVRIVHGKGYGSKGGDPVLKDTVRRWLSQLVVVQAYIECDDADGGAGAVRVLLSKLKL